jgi:holo-[acyl-carrier protein] synthase
MRIGIDAVDVDRFKAIARRRGARLLDRLFTAREQSYARRGRGDRYYERLAGRFAVKEALYKAVGGPLPFTSVEVLHGNGDGAPTVSCSRVDAPIHVSLTHTRRLAVAVVLVSGGERVDGAQGSTSA